MSGMLVHDPAAEEDAAALETLVRSAAETGIARTALLLRLSSLPRSLARPHHLRLSREALAPLTVADRARWFSLPNGDLALVWRGSSPALDGVLATLGRLFAGADSAPDMAELAEVMTLPDATDRLLAAIDDSRLPHSAPPPAPAIPGRDLDLPTLATLEAALARADMARFARRRPVCSWSEAGFTLLWEHRLLSMAELAEALAPDHDLQAEPWLRRRLGRTLDRRLLALLAAPHELRDAAPFGLDLNVASLLGPDFLRFDAGLPPELRGQVTLTLDAADALADPAAFVFARDFAQSRQYRVILGGVAAGTLAVLPRAGFGVSLLRLAWSEALPTLDPDLLAGTADGLLLAGVDSKAALAWGRAAGIRLFQGAIVAPAAGLTAAAPTSGSAPHSRSR